MSSSDADVNQWFDEYLVGFVGNDVRAAIGGTANYGAALMLLCYTEVIGGINNGQLGMSGKGIVQANFNAGLALLDVPASHEPGSTTATHYSGFAVKLNGTTSSLYYVLRCGLVHEYFGKGLVTVKNDETDPKGASVPGRQGVEWAPGGSHVIVHTNALFKHFRIAVENLRQGILADTQSTGARKNFDAGLNTLNGRVITP